MTKVCWKYRLVPIIAIIAAIGGGAGAAVSAPQIETLDNEMTVIVEEVPSSSVVCVRYYIGTGSIYEKEFLGAGISHYLEHLVGGGSENRTAAEIEHAQEEMGNQTNAYTTSDHTCYFMTTAGRFGEKAIDLIGDYVFHPLLSKKEVNKQRSIILREMAMAHDNPSRQLHRLLSKTMFRNHPARYPTIGYPDQFKQISRTDIVNYHKRTYTPDNAVVVIAGDMTRDDAVAKVEEVCGDLKKRATGSPSLPHEPPQVSPRRSQQIVPSLHEAYMAFGYHTIDLFHPDLYALDVLDYVLGAGASSRLVAEVKEDKGLVNSISCYSDTPNFGAGRFVITATLPQKNLKAAEKAILAEIEALKKHPVSAEELKRAKNQKQAEQVYRFDSVQGLAATIGRDYISTGDPQFSQHYVDNIQKVTAGEVQRVARKYFERDNLTVVTRTPEAKKPQKQAPKAAPPAQTRKTTLSNGIVLLTRQNNNVQSVHLQASFAGGLRYETAETAGLGRVMASMLKRGTTTRARMEIARKLNNAGAKMTTLSGRNSFNVSAQAVEDDVHTIFALLADCVRNPAFFQKELRRVKALKLQHLKAKRDKPSEITSRLMLQNLFEDHPYRLDPDGTTKVIKDIDRDALSDYHRKVCQPRKMVLSVYGNITTRRAQKLAENYFADWQPQAVQPPKIPSQAPLQKRKTFSRKRHQKQAMVYYGFRGIQVDSSDRYALDVLDAAFSGVRYPGGRLHRKLRGEGLVYATHMAPVAGIDPGFVMVYAWTKPTKVATVKDTVKQLVSDIQAKPLPQDELKRAKKMCIAANQVGLDSIGDRIMQQTLDELYGIGYDACEKYPDRIQQVTASDVQAAAKKYMPLDRCVIVTTKPADEGGGNG